MRRTFRLSCLILIALVTVLKAQESSIRTAEPRCEYLANPLGIDVARPRLSWVLEAIHPGDRGLKQSAYRILVASSAQALEAGTGDLWDSGKVDSDQSTQIAYRGKALASGTQAFWKVEAWDQAGHASGWSKTATWSMGLLKPEDWKGKWIGLDETGLYKRPGSPFHNLDNARWIWLPGGEPATSSAAGDRYFRASFEIQPGSHVVKAVCVMGAEHEFELFLNGEHAGKGDDVYSPQVIDVTSRTKIGSNLLAVRAKNEGAGKPAGSLERSAWSLLPGSRSFLARAANGNRLKQLRRIGRRRVLMTLAGPRPGISAASA